MVRLLTPLDGRTVRAPVNSVISPTGHQTAGIGGIRAVVISNPLKNSMSVMFLSQSSLVKPSSLPTTWQIAFSFKGHPRVCALSPN